MKLRRMRPKWVWRLAAIVLVVAATVVWTLFNRDFLFKIKKKLTPSTMIPVKEVWVLELHTEHPVCGHVDITQDEFDSETLLKEAISQKAAEYRLKEQKNFSYIYTIRGEDLCRSCLENRYIGIYNGKVAVIRGTPDKAGPVLETTEIHVNLLPKAELDDLKLGIRFRNEQEKLQLLEGLNGLIFN